MPHMNCPICQASTQAKEHGEATLFICQNSECRLLFFDRQVALAIIPPELSNDPQAFAYAQLILLLSPYIKSFQTVWSECSDEQLTQLATDRSGVGFTFLAQWMLPDLMGSDFYFQLKEGREEEPISVLTRWVKGLLALSLGSEIASRTAEQNKPAANWLAKVIKKDWDINSKELFDLAHLSQYRPQGRTRHNPEGLGHLNAEEEENNAIILQALAEKLVTDPLPNILTNKGLLKIVQGGLNYYVEQADNRLKAILKTLQERSAMGDTVKKNLSFRVELATESEIVNNTLLTEIKVIASNILTPTQQATLELYLQSYSQEEIAEERGVSQSAISQQLAQISKRISLHLGNA